jgi:hypothetical protein
MEKEEEEGTGAAGARAGAGTGVVAGTEGTAVGVGEERELVGEVLRKVWSGWWA